MKNRKNWDILKKKCRKILVIQKKVVPLHSQLRNQPVEVAMILGYGVMVTLQILVLSFLVRVRVSQLVSIFQKWKMLFLFVSLVCRRGIETLKRCLYFFGGYSQAFALCFPFRIFGCPFQGVLCTCQTWIKNKTQSKTPWVFILLFFLIFLICSQHL